MNREIMSQFGFNYVGACNCSGTLTEKYFDGRYTVMIKPRRRLFKIAENNQTIIPLSNWITLENILNQYATTKTFNV